MPIGTLKGLVSALSRRGRLLKRLRARAERIRALETTMRALDDQALLALSSSLRERHLSGADLDHLMDEAFAAVREAIRRELNLDTRETQLMGGIALSGGAIAEMATGEGKTIVALYPVFLQSLSGKGVHVATLNAYLAERDHAQAQAVLARLGCTVALLRQGMKPVERRRAYAADVTYAACGELVQDYLRDHLQLTPADCVQRGHASIIIDEIDAILIDEARSLVSLNEAYEPSERTYLGVQAIVGSLDTELMEIDPDTRAVYLTEAGQDAVDAALRSSGLIDAASSLYDQTNVDIAHHVLKALQANFLYQRDKDYVVAGGKIVAINPITGRGMPGARLGDGLHQALEAKEGVALGPETQVLASISMQNYFRLYKKRAGMTATAADNAKEFFEVYGLEVVPLPPHTAMHRVDEPDQVFQTLAAKLDAIRDRVLEAHRKGQPVLVGTTSIHAAEAIAGKLDEVALSPILLTARHDADEAIVIARAGMPGAVTIAANMAGRGTDIQLGGPPPSSAADAGEHAQYEARRASVLDAGGLLVIGADRHDSQRLDQQLRGRSGRQGDPGSSIFLLSLEDEMLRPVTRNKADFFTSCDVSSRAGQRWAQVFISRYQKNIETRHSQARVQLMRFDDVVHKQRQVIFAERLRVMESPDLTEVTSAMREQAVSDLVERHLHYESIVEEEECASLRADAIELLGFEAADLEDFDRTVPSAAHRDDIGEFLKERAADIAQRRRAKFGPELYHALEMQTILNAIDVRWNEHSRLAERLRSVVGLRAYGRRDPLVEYQTEAFDLFEKMLESLRLDVTRRLAVARPLDDRQQMKAMESLLFGS